MIRYINKRRNAHGVAFRKSGNFYRVLKPTKETYMLNYIRYIDIDLVTPELVMEDYEDFETGRYFWSRVNKHGVEFLIEGARFTVDGVEYEIGLPYLSDVTHLYTPEMLVDVMLRHGSYSNSSQLWKPVPELTPAATLHVDPMEEMELKIAGQLREDSRGQRVSLL